MDSENARAKKTARFLTAAGYECFLYSGKERFFNAFDTHPADILILDIIKAKEAGRNFIQKAKKKGVRKILLLADTEDLSDLAAVLSAGADDYLCFPIRMRELLTRISVMARQLSFSFMQDHYLTYDEFVFACYPNELKYQGRLIKVTAKEFDLALLLFRHIGKPLSRAHIAEVIWKMDSNDMARTIDTHISRVRNKLNLKPDNGFLLEQIYGFGYQLRPLAKK